MFDDFYLAVGPNARARVEIGDRPTYADCTKLTVLTPNSWSNDLISGVVREGSFTSSEASYLFVVDSNGEVSSQGFPVIWDSTIPPPPPPPNQPPIANDDNRSTTKNQSVSFNLTGSDPNSNPITFRIVNSPQNGSLDTSNIPSVTYTPNTDYVGPDQFTFKVNDGEFDSDVAMVTLTISENPPPNQPPVVGSITLDGTDVDSSKAGIQIEEGTTVIYSGSVSDPDNNPVSWEWFYALDGGPEFSMLSGVLPPTNVQDVSFDYPVGSAGTIYRWILRANDGEFSRETSLLIEVVEQGGGPGPPEEAPQPFKNVFNPLQDNALEIPCEKDIKIADRKGQIVRDLRCGVGAKSVSWDGKTNGKDRVSSGVYIVLEPEVSNRKVVVIN